MLGRFTEDLVALQRAIRWGEGDKLFDLFTRTRAHPPRRHPGRPSLCATARQANDNAKG